MMSGIQKKETLTAKIHIADVTGWGLRGAGGNISFTENE
jgi:hypothetical protein